MIVAVDVGGTFTDVVAVAGDRITTLKVPTSAVQSEAIAHVLDDLAATDDPVVLVHGTTVATNTLLERSGASTALITDAGFEDVIEIARQERPSLYDPFADRAAPLVERNLRLSMSSSEGVKLPEGVSAVAVAFLDGHENAERERAVRDALDVGPEVPISLSSEVAPEFREFERVSTTVLNAYVGPKTSHYLRQLDRDVVGEGRARSVSVMRSSGGLMALDTAARLPAAILLSGPAGGAVAARDLAGALGRDRIVSFDMGGTSTDVCRIEGGVIDTSYERSIDGYACRMPSVAIHTVGAGGGSIAWIDPGGSLRVGPQSAGASPGPACYRRGGAHPTVTDANVVLGRISAQASFGGSIVIDIDAASTAIDSVADPLGLSRTAAALGIVEIAEHVMADAVRTVSIEEGVDPAGAWLVAFGGAGGLHASSIARSLGMAGVLVPPHAGVFSALGLAAAPPRADAVAAVAIVAEDLTEAVEAAARLEASVCDQLEAAGHDVAYIERHLDVRYVGQAHEITVPWLTDDDRPDVRARFDRAHNRRNGFARPDDPIEIVGVRCVAFGEPALSEPFPVHEESAAATMGTRSVVAAAGATADAWVCERSALPEDRAIAGPGVIEDVDATTYVGVGERARRLADGTIEVTW